ncbi:bifunctional riboflavin kinase/FAD synthetase [Ornithinibacillus halophilus]|uniref:Riboflavin biosynthesis protein n=1 Tax=Ornithinibacillus halophilus TaxID=930117 RepID=A0A1M5CDW6_9BACI|nr:bifunctional riboflavin kinase/FAD synthetase [Ornithinibacillus halophilus]SHF52622.1 FMN adenylyltransferase /riboflavin kinase [Ornithinibacillus halophilus]
MKVIELTYPHSLEQLPKTVTAIGFFDGIHKGHQTVINKAVDVASANNLESAVITFHPHPSVILRNKEDVQYITPMSIKKRILEQLGVDRLYIVKFNKELASLTPQSFIDHFIVGLNIQHVVAGFDFSFGHKGKGNMNNIGEFARGRFTYTVIDKVVLEDEKISSTRIRNLLENGDVQKVSLLLGRPFTTIGTVIEGDQRGRKIGYPTANIEVKSEALLPKPGIYAVKVIVNGRQYNGMASLGTNPTFTVDRTDLSLEINILDYNQNIYGQELKVEWYTFIRDEVKFNQVDELINKISEDEKEIREYFSNF